MPSTQSTTFSEYRSSNNHFPKSDPSTIPTPNKQKHSNANGKALRPERRGNFDTKPILDTTIAKEKDFSASTYSWPIFLAILPPVVSVFHGDARAWSDLMLLALVGFYLFLIIKVPWELYFAARKRRVYQNTQTDQPGNAIQEAIRSEAINKLHRQEQLSLLLVLASPILGGYLLQMSRQFLSDYDKYFSQLNIMIFIFAAGIKPVSHMIGLIKNRAMCIQQDIHYPNSEVEGLRTRLENLEAELYQLRTTLATKPEIGEYKQDMQPTLIELTKWLQKFELREQISKKQQAARLDELESRLGRIELNVTNVPETDGLKRGNALMWLVDLISRVIWLPLNMLVFCLHCFNYLIPFRLLQHTESPDLVFKRPVGKRKTKIANHLPKHD